MEKCKLGLGKPIIMNKHLHFCQRQIGFYEQLLITASRLPIVRANKSRGTQDPGLIQGQTIFGAEFFCDRQLWFHYSLHFITSLLNRDAEGLCKEAVLTSK